MNDRIPIQEKYILTIDEASEYFNIGKTKMHEIARRNRGSNFILENGKKFLVKRNQFEKYLDAISSI